MGFIFSRGFVRRANFLALVLIASIPAARAQTAAPDPEASFQAGIQPIIFKNCNGCHTFGGHAGELRMDSLATVMKGGGRGLVVVPGHPESSLLLKAVQYDDSDLKMPPRGKLADSDIAAIEKWIRELPADAASGQAQPAPAEVKPAEVPKPAIPAQPEIASPPAQTPTPELAAPKITPEQEQFFEAKVRPLLTKNCYSCHTRSASGGLRLDSREAVLKGGKDGAVVVPGHPESSLLIAALNYKAAIQMPPSGPLKPEEIALVEQWIKAGVPWPKSSPSAPVRQVTEADRAFWAFHVPDRPSVPAAKSAWAHNDIDRFILAKLEEKHLKPVADADKRTLIRRVTYDLTGLPPTPSEVQAFLDDKAPKAYEQLVERLLASKAYGERWGRMWLDVVRYADTSGGGGDYPDRASREVSRLRHSVFQSTTSRTISSSASRSPATCCPAQSESEHWQNIIATGYLAGTNRVRKQIDLRFRCRRQSGIRISRRHARLRALPRSQVRSYSHCRLLCDLRHTSQH